MQRKTRQRHAIRKAFEDADRPLGPREVLQSAKESAPALGIATVYRNVKAMVEDGLLLPVDLPGAPSRYELAGKGHHHHFHCRGCDGVFEVKGCPKHITDLTPRGYQLESHEIILYGLCDACAAS